MFSRSLRIATLPVLIATGCAFASAPDSSTALHPYIGGELSSTDDPYLYSPVNAYLCMGMYGSENSFGLQLSIRDIYTEFHSKNSSSSGSYSYPSSSTSDMSETKMAVVGLDLRHYLRPINNPRHAPFISLTAAKFIMLTQEASSKDSKPDVGSYALGLGFGEEVPVGALSLSGKIGGRYQVVDAKWSSTSSSGSGAYSYSSSSETSRTYSNTSLDVTLGIYYRF